MARIAVLLHHQPVLPQGRSAHDALLLTVSGVG